MHTIFVLLIFFTGSPYQPEILPIRFQSMEACQAWAHPADGHIKHAPGYKAPDRVRWVHFTQCADFPASYKWPQIRRYVDQQLAVKARADCNMSGMAAGFDQAAVMQACTTAVGSQP